MTICLRAITRENWYSCTQLQLRPGQQDFVSPVALSLAQSKFEPERVPLAVYDDALPPTYTKRAPPSQSMIVPVIKPFWIKKTMACATSSGSPMRSTGSVAAVCAK